MYSANFSSLAYALSNDSLGYVTCIDTFFDGEYLGGMSISIYDACYTCTGCPSHHYSWELYNIYLQLVYPSLGGSYADLPLVYRYAMADILDWRLNTPSATVVDYDNMLNPAYCWYSAVPADFCNGDTSSDACACQQQVINALNYFDGQFAMISTDDTNGLAAMTAEMQTYFEVNCICGASYVASVQQVDESSWEGWRLSLYSYNANVPVYCSEVIFDGGKANTAIGSAYTASSLFGGVTYVGSGIFTFSGGFSEVREFSVTSALH